MATTCGKKARRSGGTRAACKRGTGSKTKRTFGKVAKNTVAENEAFNERVRRARFQKYGHAEFNGYVEV